MPKKIKNCFYERLTFEKLMEAHQRARKGKTYTNEVIRFELNLENNIVNLLNQIKNNKYHLGEYKSFKIREPKERTIKALPYVDRVVHQWYVEEFIKPYILPRFIFSTYACLDEKGAHKAVEQVEKYMRIMKRNNGRFWTLKCDIKKFFYSIDPNILYNILERMIQDKELLKFTKLLIYDKREPGETVGIPIGNYTSQFFANIYLNELDQYIKRVLRIKYYVRYMDDFIILLNTKQECIDLKKDIEEFLAKNLKLELNAKSRYYPDKMGVNFCGYRTFTTHRLLRTDSKTKMKNKVRRWNKQYYQNRLNYHRTMQSINSWLGHTAHCNAYALQKKILNKCDFLLNDKMYENIENEIIHLSEKQSKNKKIV